jgi:hypothetical protein
MGKPQYGYEHRKDRTRAIDAMPNGAPCPRCNRPMYKWQRLQLGHVVSVAMGGSGGPTRIEHGSCNERAGARLGNRLRRIRRRRSDGMPSLGDRLSDGMPSSGVPMPSAKGSKPSSSKPITNTTDKSMDGIGGIGSGIASNSSPANQRLPKW